MKSFVISLCTGAALALTGGAAVAQDTAAADGQAVETADDGPQTSDFRTFAPTQREWERFRAAGEITHEGGEAVYNAVCAGCHMPEGGGAVGAGAYPALAENDLLADPSYPIYLVVAGQKAMPPFGNLLDDQQIADVVNYIRSHFGNAFIEEYGEATAAQVKETRP